MESSPSTLSKSSAEAKQSWEVKNGILETLDVNPQNDSSTQISIEKPWINDSVFFKRVKISELALLRMVTHASSSPAIEVVGLLKGKADGDAFFVIDAFALPVQCDESGSDAQLNLLEYYKTQTQDVGLENVVGWYRSQPYDGDRITRDDVSTQMQIQQLKEPSLSLVIEPRTTVSLEKVIMKAFRTYPEGFTPPNQVKYRPNVPEMVLEINRHHRKYYVLDSTFFKSLQDASLLESVWSSYWAHTISVSTSDSKSSDQKLSGGNFSSVENKGEPADLPFEYFVYVKGSFTGMIRDPIDIFDALMEEAGGSGSQISTYTSMFFFAMLDDEQAKKLASLDGVGYVKPMPEYYPGQFSFRRRPGQHINVGDILAKSRVLV